MTQVRRTVSLSLEFDVNFAILAEKRSESFSSLLEMLLREHPLVIKEIEAGRLEESIEDFGIIPRKGSPAREALDARMKEAAASGGESPKSRRKGAPQP